MTSNAGTGYTYGAQSASCPDGALSKPHAVVAAGADSFCYDPNGNQVRRTVGGSTYNLSYDAENRLVGVSGAASASFVYGPEGGRVEGTVGGATTLYVGPHYEVGGSTVRKYYDAGGRRVAMRRNGTLYWLLSDHLGSTSVTAYRLGGKKGEVRYTAWGEDRYTYGSTPTTYRYTGQRQEAVRGHRSTEPLKTAENTECTPTPTCSDFSGFNVVQWFSDSTTTDRAGLYAES